MHPPRSFELTVTTIDPIQKIMKMSANSGYEASAEDEAEDCVPKGKWQMGLDDTKLPPQVDSGQQCSLQSAPETNTEFAIIS